MLQLDKCRSLTEVTINSSCKANVVPTASRAPRQSVFEGARDGVFAGCYHSVAVPFLRNLEVARLKMTVGDRTDTET